MVSRSRYVATLDELTAHVIVEMFGSEREIHLGMRVFLAFYQKRRKSRSYRQASGDTSSAVESAVLDPGACVMMK